MNLESRKAEIFYIICYKLELLGSQELTAYVQTFELQCLLEMTTALRQFGKVSLDSFRNSTEIGNTAKTDIHKWQYLSTN